MPWINVAALAVVLVWFLLPRAAEGSTLARVAAAVLIVLGVPMLVAAIVFTADVVRGRYPRPEDR